MRIAVNGGFVVQNAESKAQLKTIKDNAQLFARCLSREMTYRTPEENEKTVNEYADCAGLYKKLSNEEIYKNGDLARWTASRIDPQLLTLPGMNKDTYPGSKTDVALNLDYAEPASENDDVTAHLNVEINGTGRRGALYSIPGATEMPHVKNILNKQLAPGEKAEVHTMNLQNGAGANMQYSVSIENPEEAPKQYYVYVAAPARSWWWPF